MMIRTLTIVFYLLCLLSLCNSRMTGQIPFRVMSYNVENLFDTRDDPTTADNDFLPDSDRHWTHGRYYHKLQQIAKVITAAGEWDTPALVALCEVENDSVLFRLLHHTPLRHRHYRYCMTHGGDERGINVALLYQRDRFRYAGHTEHPVRFSRRRHKQTRHILHVWGTVLGGDRLDVFVCHFPSRYGGEKESESDRFDAARTLRRLCDSVHLIRPTPHILVMGDFNDTPNDMSICKELGTEPLGKNSRSDSDVLPSRFSCDDIPPLQLYNLFAATTNSPPGSHKYQGEWNLLDQIIISASLTDTTATMHLVPGSVRIFAPPFLLTRDKTWRGRRPFRTYYGFKYEGGYSDHLPLTADFLLLK